MFWSWLIWLLGIGSLQSSLSFVSWGVGVSPTDKIKHFTFFNWRWVGKWNWTCLCFSFHSKGWGSSWLRFYIFSNSDGLSDWTRSVEHFWFCAACCMTPGRWLYLLTQNRFDHSKCFSTHFERSTTEKQTLTYQLHNNNGFKHSKKPPNWISFLFCGHFQGFRP